MEEIAHMPYRWAIGLDGSKFFQEIKEREVLLGIRCPKCRKVYVPPRLLCGPCFVKMDELVELGKEGVVEAVTLVNYPFIGPDTVIDRFLTSTATSGSTALTISFLMLSKPLRGFLSR
jgi:uncharacterized OB-fold protein